MRAVSPSHLTGFFNPTDLHCTSWIGRFLIHHERVITVYNALALGNMTPIP